jgi:hypothetical protein
LGCSYIGLLGYDMRIVEQKDGKLRSHYHDEYSNTENARTYQEEFVTGFRGWQDEAKKVNVEIFNLTPDSAVTDFPIVTLDEFLNKIQLPILELVS